MENSQKERAGSLRLLRPDDAASPIVGWRSASAGLGGLVNPKGWAMLRVVVQKLIDGKVKDLYDQPLLVENAGAIVVCQAGDKVGLVQNYRFVGKRLMNAGKDYVRRLNDEGRWDELVADLGSWCWELPRGLSQLDDETDLEKFVIATAKAEALEESGFGVADARVRGMLNVNPTFFAHGQYVVHGRVVSSGVSSPEDMEIIGQTTLFNAAQIRSMVDRTEIQDGLTLAALAMAGFHF